MPETPTTPVPAGGEGQPTQQVPAAPEAAASQPPEWATQLHQTVEAGFNAVNTAAGNRDRNGQVLAGDRHREALDAMGQTTQAVDQVGRQVHGVAQQVHYGNQLLKQMPGAIGAQVGLHVAGALGPILGGGGAGVRHPLLARTESPGKATDLSGLDATAYANLMTKNYHRAPVTTGKRRLHARKAPVGDGTYEEVTRGQDIRDKGLEMLRGHKGLKRLVRVVPGLAIAAFGATLQASTEFHGLAPHDFKTTVREAATEPGFSRGEHVLHAAILLGLGALRKSVDMSGADLFNFKFQRKIDQRIFNKTFGPQKDAGSGIPKWSKNTIY